MLFRRRTGEEAAPPSLDPAAVSPGDVLVLGPGCARCDALYEATCAAIETLGCPRSLIGRVEDLDDLAEYGPILTPALVVRGAIALSGRVPATGTVLAILSRTLAATA